MRSEHLFVRVVLAAFVSGFTVGNAVAAGRKMPEAATGIGNSRYDGIYVSVKSDGAPIRQVKVVDERGRIAFDTGLFDGGKSWSRRIPVESALRFKVYAVDASGDVAILDSNESVKRQFDHSEEQAQRKMQNE